MGCERFIELLKGFTSPFSSIILLAILSAFLKIKIKINWEKRDVQRNSGCLDTDYVVQFKFFRDAEAVSLVWPL